MTQDTKNSKASNDAAGIAQLKYIFSTPAEDPTVRERFKEIYSLFEELVPDMPMGRFIHNISSKSIIEILKEAAAHIRMSYVDHSTIPIQNFLSKAFGLLFQTKEEILPNHCPILLSLLDHIDGCRKNLANQSLGLPTIPLVTQHVAGLCSLIPPHVRTIRLSCWSLTSIEALSSLLDVLSKNTQCESFVLSGLGKLVIDKDNKASNDAAGVVAEALFAAGKGIILQDDDFNRVLYEIYKKHYEEWKQKWHKETKIVIQAVTPLDADTLAVIEAYALPTLTSESAATLTTLGITEDAAVSDSDDEESPVYGDLVGSAPDIKAGDSTTVGSTEEADPLDAPSTALDVKDGAPIAPPLGLSVFKGIASTGPNNDLGDEWEVEPEEAAEGTDDQDAQDQGKQPPQGKTS